MRFITTLCFVLAASIVSIASAGDVKVGLIDLQKVFKEYPGYDKAQAKFKDFAKKEEEKLVDSKQEMADLKKELDSSGSLMTAKEKQRKEAKLNKMFEEFNQESAQIQNELAAKESDMTMGLLDEIKAVVADVAKDKGLDLVLDSEKTVYAKDGVDLTDPVLKKFKTLKLKDDDSKDDSKDSKK